MRRKDLKAVKIVIELSVERRRKRRERSKKWLNAIECDIRTVSVCVNNLGDQGN